MLHPHFPSLHIVVTRTNFTMVKRWTWNAPFSTSLSWHEPSLYPHWTRRNNTLSTCVLMKDTENYFRTPQYVISNNNFSQRLLAQPKNEMRCISSLVTDTQQTDQSRKEDSSMLATCTNQKEGYLIHKDFCVGIMQKVPPLGLEPRYPA